MQNYIALCRYEKSVSAANVVDFLIETQAKTQEDAYLSIVERAAKVGFTFFRVERANDLIHELLDQRRILVEFAAEVALKSKTPEHDLAELNELIKMYGLPTPTGNTGPDEPEEDDDRDDEQDEDLPVEESADLNLRRLRYLEATEAFGYYMAREGITATRSGWLCYVDRLEASVTYDGRTKYTHTFDVMFKPDTTEIVHISFEFEAQPF